MPVRRRSPRSATDSRAIQVTIGIVSDTHGLMRVEALTALEGCFRIIHAGDLGKLEVFERLSQIAPTFAVRGNVDVGGWADAFPETRTLTISGVNIHVLHDVNLLAFDPVDEKTCVVVSGHSHRPVIKNETGILYINPGSAGPRRFSLPVTVARLTINPFELQAELIDVQTQSSISTLSVPRCSASA